jgi:hypothetical protein
MSTLCQSLYFFYTIFVTCNYQFRQTVGILETKSCWHCLHLLFVSQLFMYQFRLNQIISNKCQYFKSKAPTILSYIHLQLPLKWCLDSHPQHILVITMKVVKDFPGICSSSIVHYMFDDFWRLKWFGKMIIDSIPNPRSQYKNECSHQPPSSSSTRTVHILFGFCNQSSIFSSRSA